MDSFCSSPGDHLEQEWQEGFISRQPQLTGVDVWVVWKNTWKKFQSHTWALWERMS